MGEGRRIIDARIGEVKRLVYCAIQPFYGKKGYEKEDMFQEAMVGVLTRGDEYDPERGSLGTFVTTVARNWLISRRFVKDGYAKRKVNFMALSLDAPLKCDNEEGSTLEELIPDDFDLEEDVVRRLDAAEIIGLIDALDARTAHIIRERYVDDDKTLRALSKEIGLCSERVRQLEAAGLRRVRVKLEHKKMTFQRRQPLNRP